MILICHITINLTMGLSSMKVLFIWITWSPIKAEKQTS